MHTQWAVVLIALVACTRAPAVQADAAPPAIPGATTVTTHSAADDCTLQTALVPGVMGSPGHLIKSDINPNGASELATLMRAFVDDLRSARTAIATGTRPQAMWARHRRMRCAWPTQASDRSPSYDAMAQGYLAAIRELESAPSARAYDSAVKACRTCHEVTCGGPLQLIDGLRREP